jgi:hypothetical protein
VEKAFEDFIVARCEAAKLENEDYIECERANSEPEEVQAKAEIVCYLKGIKDRKLFEKYLEM